MFSREVSQAVIKRLPRYYRYVGELVNENIERVSSHELSVMMGYTASQVRQDFNLFGDFGQQGYGYNVKTLYKELGTILGVKQCRSLIIVGAGNLGQALINSMNFSRYGFEIKGVFDINPRLIGMVIHGMEIQPLDCLVDFVRNENIQIAALTLPKKNAPEIVDLLVHSGIQAIWNFAAVDLNVPENVIVENVHLTESLMKLSYRCIHSTE